MTEKPASNGQNGAMRWFDDIPYKCSFKNIPQTLIQMSQFIS